MQPKGVGHNSREALRVELVSSSRQWMHATAIRSICFLEEDEARVDLVLDGNDYMATHVVAYDGDEPVGTARIRWFKDFAKIERTCFRKAHRSVHNLRDFADFVFEHIARKGYTRVITHAGAKYARLWKTLLGFKDAGKEPVFFEGQEPFYEIWKDLAPSPRPISLISSGAVLFRTEGCWDEPGAFER